MAASSPVTPPRFGLAGRVRKDGKGRESGAALLLLFFSFPSTLTLASHSCPAFSRCTSRTGEEETVEEAGVMGVMGSNLVEASDFLGGLSVQLLLSCFTTAKITFTCIVYPQFIYIIYIICSLYGSSCCIVLSNKCFSQWKSWHSIFELFLFLFFR